MSKKLEVRLSRQDLGDFLEENSDWMEQYRAELQRRLEGYDYDATVEITGDLSDKVIVDDDDDYEAKNDVWTAQNQMVNDWEWLKQ